MMDAFPIVAVAADAGDLEAVSELLSALPAQCGAALIIVQHLDAGHERSPAATIAKRTNLAVTPAHDGLEVTRHHVYLVPANATVTVAGGHMRVTHKEKASGKASGLDHPGDTLFASLAQERGASAIGVVLSGAGADGALGVRAIILAGGITFAQYPGSARFPSMPINAIETECVGFVLRPYEIAHELARLAHLPDAAAGVAGHTGVIDDTASRPVGLVLAACGQGG
jgi:two-component system, chemotaxis family, CheB/CheR fusion protein